MFAAVVISALELTFGDNYFKLDKTGKIYTVFNLITAHTPISAQIRDSIDFRFQPVYFFFTSL